MLVPPMLRKAISNLGRSVVPTRRQWLWLAVFWLTNCVAECSPIPWQVQTTANANSATESSEKSRPPVRVRKLPPPRTSSTAPRIGPGVKQARYVQSSADDRSDDSIPAITPDNTIPALRRSQEPTPNSEVYLPLESVEPQGHINLELDGELLNLSFREASLRSVLDALAESQGLNLICSSDVNSQITGSFRSVSFDDAINTVVAASGNSWTLRNNIIIVTSLTSELKLAPEAQGRQVRVFKLNYVSAVDVQKACTGLMSPSGTMVPTESDPMNNQKTREQLMVEDLPSYLDRISEVICQMDVQPQQVLIEAHILQVDLTDNKSHGVDFAKLGSVAGTDILVATPGFNGTITDLSTFATPSYNVGIFNAGDFSGLITALQKTTDAKTLASPRVLALNGQQAHIQIGKRLGYHVTTTTQTSTLQSVQFLDTGVVLTITPRITADNQIMLTVKPEVSEGSIDSLGLPSTTTTEVDTNIMLPDGKGMVIGGLIKETDITQQQKIPVLGSLWMVGKLFRKNNVTRERSEIIIALVPHIVGGPYFDAERDEVGFEQAASPLLVGPLHPAPRPWEPRLPDAIENPRRLDKSRAPELLKHPSNGPPRHLEYYFPAAEDHSVNPNIFASGPVNHVTISPGEYLPPVEHFPPEAPASKNYEYAQPRASGSVRNSEP